MLDKMTEEEESQTVFFETEVVEYCDEKSKTTVVAEPLEL